MKPYVSKFFAFIFLSGFLALTFGPYGGNPFSTEYRKSDGINKGETNPGNLIEEYLSLRNEKEPRIESVLQNPAIIYSQYILSFIFLISGIFLLYKSYKKTPGLLITPRWGAVAGDLICIFFLSFAAYCVIAFGLKNITGADPYLYDPLAMGIGALAYIPASAFCSYFVFNQFVQSLDENSD